MFLFLTPQESAADREKAPMQAMLPADRHLEGLDEESPRIWRYRGS
jgi:hypothetical protein